jgi:hypothetical protein
MSSNQQANARERVAQLEHAQQTALRVLNASERLREVCPGYNLDISSGDHERIGRQFAQVSQQLAEAKNEIASGPGCPNVMLRLFKALQSL